MSNINNNDNNINNKILNKALNKILIAKNDLDFLYRQAFLLSLQDLNGLKPDYKIFAYTTNSINSEELSQKEYNDFCKQAIADAHLEFLSENINNINLKLLEIDLPQALEMQGINNLIDKNLNNDKNNNDINLNNINNNLKPSIFEKTKQFIKNKINKPSENIKNIENKKIEPAENINIYLQNLQYIFTPAADIQTQLGNLKPYLAPEALLLFTHFGVQSFSSLRQFMAEKPALQSDLVFLDMHDMGDILQRNFSNPVVFSQIFKIEYENSPAMIKDLKSFAFDFENPENHENSKNIENIIHDYWQQHPYLEIEIVTAHAWYLPRKSKNSAKNAGENTSASEDIKEYVIDFKQNTN